MATVLLVRHGRTTANTSGVLAGRSTGVRLDDVGTEQVVRTGDRLAAVPLAAVVTSPLERCRQTAQALVDRQGTPAPAVRDKGLVEVDYGEWTGAELKSLAKEPLWKVVQGQPAAATFPGGEGLAAMAARAVATVRRWDATVEAEHGPGAVWAAVSHGDVIKAVLADALGLHLDAFQRIVVDPASVSVVRYTPGRPFVLMTNTAAGDLGFLVPPPAAKGRRRRSAKRGDSDAVVGGGAGPAGR
ncbi:MAG: Phosphoglycerate mutase family protein [uncultured Nocardioidaceae bacterium]|uniref:Phosphoglycerate mutase family protein n=1 Tax=uncultured Nocardioidaceae bacterium TaxID=253824 RepID=A0A6J4LH19_9ACTN|nr:MAG: Phosphoglycerate mutase family protein [uncultured Nocardioidaceae bacterium]